MKETKTLEEKRAYQREAQRRWRANHPEYKERQKQAYRDKLDKMTADERREYNKEQSKKVREWQRRNPERMCYNAMMELARRTNYLVIPDTPETRAALEGVNAQCAKIVEEARVRKKSSYSHPSTFA